MHWTEEVPRWVAKERKKILACDKIGFLLAIIGKKSDLCNVFPRRQFYTFN